jgi:hypothetical protein
MTASHSTRSLVMKMTPMLPCEAPYVMRITLVADAGVMPVVR